MSEERSSFIKEQLEILKRETEDALNKVYWIAGAANRFNLNQSDGEEISTSDLYSCKQILLEFRRSILKKLRSEE